MFDAVLAAALAINRSLEESRLARGSREMAVTSLRKALSGVSFVGASVRRWEGRGGEERGEGEGRRGGGERGGD